MPSVKPDSIFNEYNAKGEYLSYWSPNSVEREFNLDYPNDAKVMKFCFVIADIWKCWVKDVTHGTVIFDGSQWYNNMNIIDARDNLVCNGTTIVNTGYYLWNGSLPNWHIHIEADVDKTTTGMHALLGAINESGSPYPGMVVFSNNGGRCQVHINPNPSTVHQGEHTDSGIDIIEIDKTDNTYTVTVNGTTTVSTRNLPTAAVDIPLTLGNELDSKGNPFNGRYYVGTIHTFKLWSNAAFDAPKMGMQLLLMRHRHHVMSFVDFSKYPITKYSNPCVMQACYGAGWAKNPNYMTYEECAAVTDIKDVFNNSRNGNYGVLITHFDEFQYFTGVTGCTVSYPFGTAMKTVTAPPNYGWTMGHIVNAGTAVDRITFLDGAKVFKLQTNGVGHVKLLQLLGDTTTLYGYDNVLGNNSFYCYKIDKLQMAGEVVCGSSPEVWYVFGDVGIESVAALDTDRCYPMEVELVDKQGNVIEENEWYKMVDGTLYSKDMTSLNVVNRNVTEFTIPPSVKHISQGAFCGTLLTKLFIPATVEEFNLQGIRQTPTLKELRVEASDNIVESLVMGDNFDRGMTSLEKVIFPKNVYSRGFPLTCFMIMPKLRILECGTVRWDLSFAANYKAKAKAASLEKLVIWTDNKMNKVSQDFMDNALEASFIVYVPDEWRDTYLANDIWSQLGEDRIRPTSEYVED